MIFRIYLCYIYLFCAFHSRFDKAKWQSNVISSIFRKCQTERDAIDHMVVVNCIEQLISFVMFFSFSLLFEFTFKLLSEHGPSIGWIINNCSYAVRLLERNANRLDAPFNLISILVIGQTAIHAHTHSHSHHITFKTWPVCYFKSTLSDESSTCFEEETYSRHIPIYLRAF